jgi:hypothetical protein
MEIISNQYTLQIYRSTGLQDRWKKIKSMTVWSIFKECMQQALYTSWWIDDMKNRNTNIETPDRTLLTSFDNDERILQVWQI